MAKEPINIRYYKKENCSLCDGGLQLLKVLSNEFPLVIEEIDIYEDDGLLERFQLKIPVVEANDEEIGCGQLRWGDLRKELLRIFS